LIFSLLDLLFELNYILLVGAFKSQAFTLVETLIVVAVVSIVTAIAVAALGTSKGDTQRTKRDATISAIEQAKNRYVLDADFSVFGEDTQLEEIAPYLAAEGKPIDSIFNLVEGTGRELQDLDLGKYQIKPASFSGDGDSGGLEESDPDYVFDPSDREATMAALQTILGMDTADPEYSNFSDSILEAINRGTIEEFELGDGGLGIYEGTVYPRGGVLNFTYQDLATAPEKVNYFNELDSWDRGLLFSELGGDDKRLLVENVDFAIVRSMVTSNNLAGYGDVLNYFSDSDALVFKDFSGLNLTGWDPINKSLEGIDFNLSNVTVAQLNSPNNLTGPEFPFVDIQGTNLQGRNLTGLITTDRVLNDVNFTGATISTAQLNQASSYTGAKLNGRNLSGLNTSNKSLNNVDMSNSTNITMTMLTGSNGLRGMKLTGTGITRPALQAALDANVPPRAGFQYDLNTVTF
jgi:prepilin-type N-terminal cleavage/methylation domain-containing protein